MRFRARMALRKTSLIVDEGSLRVRHLVEADAPLLVRWLSDPRVLEFYGGRDRPYDVGSIRQSFFNEEPITRCMVEWQGRSIGYLQFYEVPPSEMTEYGYRADEPVYGMDQFIGEPELWNRGIGTRTVAAVARYLKASRALRVVTDPETWNVRAVRSYEKAGFRKVRLLPKHEWHEGQMRDSWLMEYLPTAAGKG